MQKGSTAATWMTTHHDSLFDDDFTWKNTFFSKKIIFLCRLCSLMATSENTVAHQEI